MSSRGDASEKDRDSRIGIEVTSEAVLNEKFANLIDYVTVPSDKSVKPIIANPEIEKLEDFEYQSQVDGMDLVNLHDLSTMDKDQLEQYLVQVYKYVVATTSPKERLNMLHYFVSIIQNSSNANLIIESLFMDLFVKLLKTVKSKQFKVDCLFMADSSLYYHWSVSQACDKRQHRYPEATDRAHLARASQRRQQCSQKESDGCIRRISILWI